MLPNLMYSLISLCVSLCLSLHPLSIPLSFPHSLPPSIPLSFPHSLPFSLSPSFSPFLTLPPLSITLSFPYSLPPTGTSYLWFFLKIVLVFRILGMAIQDLRISTTTQVLLSGYWSFVLGKSLKSLRHDQASWKEQEAHIFKCKHKAENKIVEWFMSRFMWKYSHSTSSTVIQSSFHRSQMFIGDKNVLLQLFLESMRRPLTESGPYSLLLSVTTETYSCYFPGAKHTQIIK